MHKQMSLPSDLSIYSVGELRPQLLVRLKGDQNDATMGATLPESLRLEAASVEDVDAAGVQLLLSLANSLALAGRKLQLVNPSVALSRACAELGASALMGHADLAEVAL